MGQSFRIKAWFVGVFLLTYFVFIPGLMDEYLLSRFAWLSLSAMAAMVTLLKKPRPIRVNYLDLTLVSFYLISMLSLFWAGLPSAGLVPLQTVLIMIVFYFCFQSLQPKVPKLFFRRLFLLLTLVVVIITLFQIGKIGLAKGIGGKTIYEVGALSGHKNILSAYLLLLFGINLWFLPAGQSKRWMFLLLSTQVILVFLLRSRTTLVAMALFITLIAVYQIFSLGARWKIIGSRIFLGIAAMGIAAMLIFTKLGGSAKDLNQLNPANFLKDASLVERLFVWSKTKTLIAEEWLSGYGAGNWKLIFPSKSISGGFRLETKDLMFTRVHNDFLEVWAELGIGGFILFLGIFLIPLFGIFYQLKHSKGPNLKLVILAGILFSYLIISFFDFPKERLEFQVMLAFILVLVVKSTPLFFKDHHFSWTLPDRTFRYAGLIAGFLLLLNAPISYFNMKGEYHTLRTMKAQTLGLWPLVEMESARAYSPIYQVSPVAISIKWYEGLALYHQGKYEKARSAFEIAIRHTPYFTRLLNDFASCLVQLQDFEGAKELYHKVMFINPKFEDGMFNLAYVYAQLKDFDKAYEWVNKTKSNIQKKEDFIREIEVLREAAQ